MVPLFCCQMIEKDVSSCCELFEATCLSRKELLRSIRPEIYIARSSRFVWEVIFCTNRVDFLALILLLFLF